MLSFAWVTVKASVQTSLAQGGLMARYPHPGVDVFAQCTLTSLHDFIPGLAHIMAPAHLCIYVLCLSPQRMKLFQLVRFFVPQQLALCLGENRHSTVKWLTWMNEQLMPQKWKDRTIHLFFTCRPGSRSVFHLGDREQLLQHSLLTELAASLKTGYCFGRPDPDAPALSALHVLILLTMFLNKEKRTQEYFLLILQMFINSSQTLKKGLFSWLYVTALLAKTSKHGMQMKPFTTVCM